MNTKNIEILKELLNEVPRLMKHPLQRNAHSKWHTRVVSTLELLFGKNSRQYNRFTIRAYSYNRYATNEERQAEYRRDITQDKNILEAIIAGLEQEIKIKKTIRSKRILNFVHSSLNKIWQELKDFVATIIAKFFAEKSK